MKSDVELLAPAGDKECFIAAVQNGADAIYLGGTMFNARAFAKNFDYDEILWAIHYAHQRGVKVYVTINTLYKDEEFESLMKYIDQLYDMQVDALIVQDLGLFHLLRESYPDFDIHASTQSSVMNVQGVLYYENNGATRVVLARENTIEEIREICSKTNIEIEVFVHGALCVSYSGQCLMSSFIGKRSGNRGACAQPCRLQYRLKKDGKLLDNKIPYLLSPKDLLTIDQIGELIDAGVTSFKVEGRMKRPEYVASVVKAYRKAIDAYLNKTKVNLDREIIDMKSTFNRDYTHGFLFHDASYLIGDYSGNKGIVVGSVSSYNKKSKRVSVLLNEDIYQGDSLVFESIDKGRPINKIYLSNRLVSHADKGDLVEIEFDYPVYKGNVRKTVNVQLMKELQKTYDKETRKQKLSFHFQAHLNEPAQLTCYYDSLQIVEQTQEIVEKAINRPLDQLRIQQQLSKLGDTPFLLEKCTFDIDEEMILPIKALNELRRKAIDSLLDQLANKKIHHINHKRDLPSLVYKKSNGKDLYVLVSNLEQLKAICQMDIKNIAFPFDDDLVQAYQITKENNKKLFLFIPRIMKENELSQIKCHPLYKEINSVIVNDIGSYYYFEDKERILGTGLNIYNSYSASLFKERKILSLEMSLKEINRLQSSHQECIVQIYGKIENMISEYCPISQFYFGKQKKKCGICRTGQFSLVDRKNEEFDLLMDNHCRMHLLNCRTLYFDDMNRLDVGGLFVHFTNENSLQAQEIMKDIIQCISHNVKSEVKKEINPTFGYLK